MEEKCKVLHETCKRKRLVARYFIVVPILFGIIAGVWLYNNSNKNNEGVSTTNVIDDKKLMDIISKLEKEDGEDAWKSIEIVQEDVDKLKSKVSVKDSEVIKMVTGEKSIEDIGVYKVGDTYEMYGNKYEVSSIEPLTEEYIDSYCKEEYKRLAYVNQVYIKALQEYNGN